MRNSRRRPRLQRQPFCQALQAGHHCGRGRAAARAASAAYAMVGAGVRSRARYSECAGYDACNRTGEYSGMQRKCGEYSGMQRKCGEYGGMQRKCGE